MNYSYDPSGNAVSRGTNAALKITGHPVSQIAAPGEVVTFSVVVSDAGAVTFQWRFNGADIAGATGDSLLLSNVNDVSEGQYSVVVTDSAGSVTSAPAALMLDRDRDGLPDTWEAANFTDPDPTHPLNPANQRSETDPDKDNVSNLDEFLEDTDPVSSASFHPRLIVHSGAGGSVTVTPMKLNYESGESVTLTAISFTSGGLVRWSGDLTGTDTPATLKMDGHKTVRASFASPVTPPPGLVALWRGETNANDVIDGHHGTFFVGTTVSVASVTTDGKVGGAFSFDGMAYVRVPDSPALKPPRLTVEAWVFPTRPSGGFQAILACGSSRNEDDTWYLGLLNSVPQFWSHGQNLLECPFAVPLNDWTHLAITYDGLIKRLFVNGVQVGSREESKPLIYDAVPVVIGSDWASNASNSRFNGRVDEVSLYNRALTADEVRGIVNADFAGKDLARPYFTSPAQLADGELGHSYAQQLVAILAVGPIEYLLSAGVLPPGMALAPNGRLSGVPNATGTFNFTARGTDSAGVFTEQLCLLRVV